MIAEGDVGRRYLVPHISMGEVTREEMPRSKSLGDRKGADNPFYSSTSALMGMKKGPRKKGGLARETEDES